MHFTHVGLSIVVKLVQLITEENLEEQSSNLADRLFMNRRR